MSMFNTFKVHPQDRVRREGSFQQFNVEGPKQLAPVPSPNYHQDYQQGFGLCSHPGVSAPPPPAPPATLVPVPPPQQDKAFVIPAITVDQQWAMGERRSRSHSLPTMEPSLNKVQRCSPSGGSELDQRVVHAPNTMHAVLAPLQTGFAQAAPAYAIITDRTASTPYYDYGMSWPSPHSSYTASPISPPWYG